MIGVCLLFFFFFSSRRRHTRWTGDWSSDVCSSDLEKASGPYDVVATALRDAVRGVGVRDIFRVATKEVQFGAAQTRSLEDRKSTRLNSSHPSISYAVFCLKKKKSPIQIKTHILSIL